ncbi:MAG: type IV pilus assembly protein PilM [Phycisphaerae bacterium]
MAAKLPVWGIDVGQCSLKALKLQPANDKVEVLAFDVVDHDAILSQAETETPAMIKKAIETFLSRNDVGDSHVVVSVPGQQTLMRFTKMPPVEKKKIPDMVKYEAGQQIPFDMDEVVWDYQIFTEEDSPDVEVGIFAIRRELIRNHLSHFTDVGIEPIVAQAGPMASYNAVRFDRPSGDGEAMILLDMGAVTTDLIVLEGSGTSSSMWSRPVPIGGNRFTEALVSAFKISFKKAEDLKRNAASTKYARQIFQAMRPVFADMVSEVQRSIGYYTSTHRETHITRVLGMGNAFKLPGLQKFLQQNLQIEVEKLTGFKRLVTAGHEKQPAFGDNIMSFAVAYGLALQGLDLAAVRSNLLPPEIGRSILWKKKRPWFVASAACLALAAGVVWGKNVMTNSAIDEGMGTVQSAQIGQAPGLDAAERIVSSAASDRPALERAVEIAKAANTFKAELNKVGAVGNDQIKQLGKIAKLPKKNVVVPRILDAIHRAFGEARSGVVKDIHSPDDYKQRVADIPRTQRDEVWIEDFWMGFASRDPASVFDSDGAGDRKRRRTAGWAIEIKGRTTRPHPEDWIGQTLKKALETLGREPRRGFYLDEVKLVKVMDGPKRRTTGRGGRRPPPRRSGFGHDRDEDRFGGRDRGRSSGFGIGGSGRNSRSGSGGRTRAVQSEIEKMRVKPGVDPLTGEDTSTDRWFVLQLVAYYRNTTKKLIPDRWKENADAAGAEDEEPAEQPKVPQDESMNPSVRD